MEGGGDNMLLAQTWYNFVSAFSSLIQILQFVLLFFFKWLQMTSEQNKTPKNPTDLQNAEAQSPAAALNLKYQTTGAWHVSQLPTSTTANPCATM